MADAFVLLPWVVVEQSDRTVRAHRVREQCAHHLLAADACSVDDHRFGDCWTSVVLDEHPPPAPVATGHHEDADARDHHSADRNDVVVQPELTGNKDGSRAGNRPSKGDGLFEAADLQRVR